MIMDLRLHSSPRYYKEWMSTCIAYLTGKLNAIVLLNRSTLLHKKNIYLMRQHYRKTILSGEENDRILTGPTHDKQFTQEKTMIEY